MQRRFPLLTAWQNCLTLRGASPYFVVGPHGGRVFINCSRDDIHHFLLLFLVQRGLLTETSRGTTRKTFREAPSIVKTLTRSSSQLWPYIGQRLHHLHLNFLRERLARHFKKQLRVRKRKLLVETIETTGSHCWCCCVGKTNRLNSPPKPLRFK